MNIESLGYIGVTTTDLDAWRRFGGEMLGMQVVERGSSLAFRLDERCQRILVDHGSSNGGSYYGFQVADELALNAAARELEARGVCVSVPDAEELRRRGVAAMCYFLDPCGNRLELFHGHAAADDPFRPSRPLRGFRTGELGLGHVVFNVPSIADVLPFYTDVLGFRVSDYAEDRSRRPFCTQTRDIIVWR